MVSDVALLCSGLDKVNRGYETHMRLLHHKLSNEQDLNVILFKGSGQNKQNEKVIFRPSRDSKVCLFLGKLRGDSVYWELLFFGFFFILKQFFEPRKFNTILVIEPLLAKFLYRIKRFLRGKPKIVFTHSVWIEPRERLRFADITHEVNIENFNKMNQFLQDNCLIHSTKLIPHFKNSATEASTQINNKKLSNLLEEVLNLKSQGKKVALSVGVIDRAHKRMDYLVNEFGNVSTDWVLILCGTIGNQDIINDANEVLGNRFFQIQLQPEEVYHLYSVADLFILCSLQEGFGIVTIEAMSNSIAVLQHNRILFKWIIDDEEQIIDMSVDGALSQKINSLSFDWLEHKGHRNFINFNERFSWGALRNEYLNLIK